jgi:hypothetical protein
VEHSRRLLAGILHLEGESASGQPGPRAGEAERVSQTQPRSQPLPDANVPLLDHPLTLQDFANPLRQLTDDSTYLLDRDRSAREGQLVYETQVFRTKLNYQFTRAWSARMIVEYDSTLANPLETSLTRTKQVQSQALITWLLHPGTVVYIGYNNDLQNYNHQLCGVMMGTHNCNPNQPILPRGPGYLNDGRQVFIKASYLIRF